MTFLEYRDFKNIIDSFYCLLTSTPGTKIDKQVFFKEKGLIVPRKNYETMWDELLYRYEYALIGDALLEYTLVSANKRTRELINEVIEDGYVDLTDYETNLIYCLFYNNGNLRRIGEYLIEYMEEINFEWGEPEIKEEKSIEGFQIEIDMDPLPLKINLPKDIDVFISCGAKDNEIPIANWLFETLTYTNRINPYWWKILSPGGGERKTFQEHLLNKARKSDAVIGVLHYREQLDNEPTAFSLSSYDEICRAFDDGVPTIVFRHPKLSLTGMFLPSLEVIPVLKASEIYNRLPSFLQSIIKISHQD
jgi:hypothetical protein